MERPEQRLSAFDDIERLRSVADFASWSARGEGVTLYPLLLAPTPETALDHPTISLAGDVGATKLVMNSNRAP